ncbi:hypothetical protein [Acetonema longum]|uniref:Uncharacterized protein n=1 Tax=Acetonema longum DSM 6540 TaxID=1009370 RepID=F7NJE7_9FIRM|nr:hypothetical protein [Acetonema longum]EGO63895.1 hypothetical protein ALO_11014 [Acetonema longum DSM 6540]
MLTGDRGKTVKRLMQAGVQAIGRLFLLPVIGLLLLTSPAFAAYDFIENGSFQQRLAGWEFEENFQPAGNQPVGISWSDNTVYLNGKVGDTRQGIQQKLAVDVASYSSLLLSVEVRVDAARQDGLGLTGTEAPVAVYCIYTDENGLLHNSLDAQSGNRMFWRGFYYLPSQLPVQAGDGVPVVQGAWSSFTYDLMRLMPRPKTIHAVGIQGAGWAGRSAAVRKVALVAPEEGRELVTNPGFRQLAAGWQVEQDFQPSEYRTELITHNEGLQLKQAFGDSRVGVRQRIEADVSGCSSLIVTADIRLERQSMGGTGWNGNEAPVALFVVYTDEQGILHDKLPEGASENSRSVFWRGLYCLDPVPPAISLRGVKVEPDRWQTVSFELMELDPKPKVIHYIGVHGAGRAPRDGAIRLLSLKSR